MNTAIWNTGEPLDPGFERAWNECLARSPLAHFGFDVRFLAEEATQDRAALAVLTEDGGRRGALVLRIAGGECLCGWPWRPGAVIEGAGASAPVPETDDLAWLWEQAGRLAGHHRLRFYAPWHPERDRCWFVGGHTYVQNLGLGEDAIWKGMDGAKRRMAKRAKNQGFTIVEARDPELLRAFAALPRDRQRPAHPAAANGVAGATVESWREWLAPWMWLLVAVRDGRVEAGSGFGLQAGGTIDYRTNASTEQAKKDGANVLLGWEALRLGRERGYRWLNWGGATRFKQEFGGTHVEICCLLGGGPAWSVPNLVDAAAHRARARLTAMRRDRARRASAAPKTPLRATTLVPWKTWEPLTPEFEQRWRAGLAEAPLANFTFAPEYLRWEAERGRLAVAVTCEGEGRRGLLVLRETRGGWVCGWPWRWAAVMRHGQAAEPGIAEGDAEWLFRCAEQAAGGRRVRIYQAAEPPPHRAGFASGATIIQAIDRPDDELFAAIHSSKRRMVKRAKQEGYEVIEGNTLEQFRAFADIQIETMSRRGLEVTSPALSPAPGESWREWELPWMWLLLAVRDGRIESGLGDGILAGGMLEGRTGASTLSARRDGAFAMLCVEEARRARDRGYRWLNHGGDTPFKREMAGTLGIRLAMHCWLGGGALWAPANRSETWARQMRQRVPRWARTLRARGASR